jgi:hypothetical protein
VVLRDETEIACDGMSASFEQHVSLLRTMVDRYGELVDRIEHALLNVQGKETARRRDRAHFDQLLHACVFGLPGLPRETAALKGQLAAKHLADGFEPVLLDNFAHQLDPLELVVSAYGHWESRRWPGKSGRLTYARAIAAVYLLRQLEYLSLAVWDDGSEQAPARLSAVQDLLDRLNRASAPIVFVRSAAWLTQTAQGPLTRRLEPYFRISESLSSLSAAQQLAAHEAGARLAGGHLRSQLRYRVWTSGRPVDDPELRAFVRNANSMDTALLVRDLVSLLERYRLGVDAVVDDDRLDLADAILQGFSADPELLLTRLDLLAPCTAIEELFVECPERLPRLTARGMADTQLMERYAGLVAALADPLLEDAARLMPGPDAYSPYGIVYGFCADLMSNIARSVLHGQTTRGLGLEDMLSSRGRLDDKRALAADWQRLPTRAGEREHFEHSGDWALQMWERLTAALQARADRPARANASSMPDARLYVVEESAGDAANAGVPAGAVAAQDYCFTSDLPRALATGATPQPARQIPTDRAEARFLASVEIDGKWFGISKLVLTMFLGQGQDAVIRHVPAAAIETLRLTCPGLVSIISR